MMISGILRSYRVLVHLQQIEERPRHPLEEGLVHRITNNNIKNCFLELIQLNLLNKYSPFNAHCEHSQEDQEMRQLLKRTITKRHKEETEADND